VGNVSRVDEPWFSLHLHAELVLHKKSAYHSQSRGSVNFLHREKFSGSDSHPYTESEPAINRQGFLLLLPRLFFQIKKSANIINFKNRIPRFLFLKKLVSHKEKSQEIFLASLHP
jgi:hypothetical protein